jgi:hypothetical protein
MEGGREGGNGESKKDKKRIREIENGIRFRRRKKRQRGGKREGIGGR